MTDAWDIKYKNYVHTISIVLMIRYTLQGLFDWIVNNVI